MKSQKCSLFCFGNLATPAGVSPKRQHDHGTITADVRSRDADVSLPGSSWNRLPKMADSLSSGPGEEKEKEKEDGVRDRRHLKSEYNKERDALADALRFNVRNVDSNGKKRNLSGGS